MTNNFQKEITKNPITWKKWGYNLKKVGIFSVSVNTEIDLLTNRHLKKWSMSLVIQFSSVQSLSHVRLFASPWTAACQVSLSITNSQSLLKLTSIELVMPSNYLILCCPLLLLPSIFPRNRVFSNESAPQVRWPKYWSFSFNIRSSNEHPRLISIRMDWLDLLAVQGTLKSLLQHHSSKAAILWHGPTLSSLHDFWKIP